MQGLPITSSENISEDEEESPKLKPKKNYNNIKIIKKNNSKQSLPQDQIPNNNISNTNINNNTHRSLSKYRQSSSREILQRPKIQKLATIQATAQQINNNNNQQHKPKPQEKQINYIRFPENNHECGGLEDRCQECGKVINPLYIKMGYSAIRSEFMELQEQFEKEKNSNNNSNNNKIQALMGLSRQNTNPSHQNTKNNDVNSHINHYFNHGIDYINYELVFRKKMELDQLPQQYIKKFLYFNSLYDIQDWAHFMLLREQNLTKCQEGFQELQTLQNCEKLSINLKDQLQLRKEQNQNFEKIKIIGDYESSNVGIATINKSLDKVQILLQNDINTKGCLHWFNFTIEVKEPCTLNIQVMNNSRNGILYKEGMGIAVYDSQLEEKGWHRSGDTIFYYRSNVDHAFYQSHLNKSQDLSNSAYPALQNNPITQQQKPQTGYNNTLNYSQKDLNTTLQNQQKTQELSQKNNFSQIQPTKSLSVLKKYPEFDTLQQDTDRSSSQSSAFETTENQKQHENQQQQQQQSIQKTALEKKQHQSPRQKLQSPNKSQNQQNINIKSQIKQQVFQTLQFNYKFTQKGQKVNFAYSYPYTFSDLLTYLNKKEQNLLKTVPSQDIQLDYSLPFEEYQNIFKGKTELVHQDLSINKQIQIQGYELQHQKFQKTKIKQIVTKKINYKRYVFGYTRLGFPLQYLKFSAARGNDEESPLEKKTIFLIARQHPSETTGSFVCQGIMDFLFQDNNNTDNNDDNNNNDNQAHILRNLYDIYIVPMVNIDGVILGQSRCSTSGYDLNRKWMNTDPILCPEVYLIKELMRKITLKKEIFIFTDLHGHSAKKHSFFYGCDKMKTYGMGVGFNQYTENWTKIRLLPKIFAEKTPMFSFKDCRFRVTPDKSSTARVVAWSEFNIMNSFTMETSFFGYYDEESQKNVPFSIKDLEFLGEKLCESFLEYYFILQNLDIEVSSVEKLQAKKLKSEQQHLQFIDYKAVCPNIKKNWRNYFNKQELIKTFKRIEQGHDPNNEEIVSGSDSDPEGDLYEDKKNVISPKKKESQVVKEEKSTNQNNTNVPSNNLKKEDKPEWKISAHSNLLNGHKTNLQNIESQPIGSHHTQHIKKVKKIQKSEKQTQNQIQTQQQQQQQKNFPETEKPDKIPQQNPKKPLKAQQQQQPQQQFADIQKECFSRTQTTLKPKGEKEKEKHGYNIPQVKQKIRKYKQASQHQQQQQPQVFLHHYQQAQFPNVRDKFATKFKGLCSDIIRTEPDQDFYAEFKNNQNIDSIIISKQKRERGYSEDEIGANISQNYYALNNNAQNSQNSQNNAKKSSKKVVHSQQLKFIQPNQSKNSRMVSTKQSVDTKNMDKILNKNVGGNVNVCNVQFSNKEILKQMPGYQSQTPNKISTTNNVYNCRSQSTHNENKQKSIPNYHQQQQESTRNIEEVIKPNSTNNILISNNIINNVFLKKSNYVNLDNIILRQSIEKNQNMLKDASSLTDIYSYQQQQIKTTQQNKNQQQSNVPNFTRNHCYFQPQQQQQLEEDLHTHNTDRQIYINKVIQQLPPSKSPQNQNAKTQNLKKGSKFWIENHNMKVPSYLIKPSKIDKQHQQQNKNQNIMSNNMNKSKQLVNESLDSANFSNYNFHKHNKPIKTQKGNLTRNSIREDKSETKKYKDIKLQGVPLEATIKVKKEEQQQLQQLPYQQQNSFNNTITKQKFRSVTQYQGSKKYYINPTQQQQQ